MRPGLIGRLGELASRRMATVSSLVFALVIAVALYLVYRNAQLTRERVSDDFNEQQLILARQAALQIDARLAQTTLELRTLADYVERAGDGHLELAAQAALRRTHSAGLRALGILAADGRVLQTWGSALPGPRAMRRAGCTSLSGALRLAALAGSPGDGAARLDSALCVTLGDGRRLVARVEVAQLVGEVTRGIRSGRTGYAWVIDEAGTFLSHSDHDFVGRNAFAARRERLPYISFSAINAIMKDRMLRGEEGTGTYVSGWHRGAQGQIEKLIGYTPVRSPALPEGAVWSVAVVAPTEEVGAAVHSIYLRHLWTQAAVVAALMVFAATAYVYQRRLSLALEERMSRQHEFLTGLLESSMDGIIFIDNDNRVQTWNKGAERIFGYTAAEMQTRTFHQLIPPEVDADRELERIQQEVRERGYVRNYIVTRRTKDGRRITIDLSRTLVYGSEGAVTGSIAVLKDITEKLELDQRMYSAEKLASIGTLAAGVAHEINNPLAIILGFADLLLERLPPSSQEHRDVGIIATNANHAKKVVQNMLGFARITEGLEESVDVAAAIETVLSICESTLLTKKIVAVRRLERELPRVRGDPRELQQVILNLVNNAVSAMQPAGGTLTVSAWQAASAVSFSIGDTGVGIPDKVKPRIFDPFFTTKKLGEGTGLGLSLAHGIVSKYGGTISFTSTTREESSGGTSGSSFVVTLPRADSEGAAA